MNPSLREKVTASGFKIKALADRIGVKPNYLAMCVRGERNLSDTKAKILKDFLEAIPA